MATVHRKRVRHFDEPGHAHFLTFSCFGRQPLFTAEPTRLLFVESLERAQAKHPFDLWAWVIMPEHVHLLIWPTGSFSVATFLQSLKASAAKKVIASFRKESLLRLVQRKTTPGGVAEFRFWQAGPGFDENVVEPRRVLDVIEYIHWNPVKRGLVLEPCDWPWSSARAWRGDGNALLRIQRHSVPSVLVP